MNQHVDYFQDETEYHRAAKAFVRAMVAELNETLTENRISKAKRRGICTSFAYSLCITFDQRWVRNEGQTYFPLLAFTKRFYDIGDSLDDVAPIQMPDRGVAFYEMFGDEADWLFDDCNDAPPSNIIGGLRDALPDEESQPESETEKICLPCTICRGSGKCYCLRKGEGDSTLCPRCDGTGKCCHCDGAGIAPGG